MKARRRATAVLLLVVAMVASLFAFSTPAYATSDYDSLLQTVSTLTVDTSGGAGTSSMDISNTWWRDFKQSYAHRVAWNGWPSSFVTTFQNDVNEGGSYGVYYYDTTYGPFIDLVASDDPDATCSFTGPATTGSFDCTIHAGYNYVKADYFTHNSYAGNGCGNVLSGNLCSSDGMNMYDAPTLYGTVSSDITPISMPDTDLSDTKFFIWNFDTTYPSGYAGEALPSTKESTGTYQYVAMGDSYSSGEGSPDFISWTNQPDTDMCHRSAANAYPEMLAADSSLNLKLVNDVACSGATTSNILYGGQYIEPEQLDALSSSTDVVTVTIGGNDVGFATYATLCGNEGFCDSDTGAYADIMSAIDGDLEENLVTTYSAILGSAPNATVYVAGYLYLVDPDGGCVTFGWADDAGVVDVISELDSVIRTAVTDAEASDPTYAGRIEYVDPNATGSPFVGHYLCSTVPYFNGITVPETEYSFHPNESGQEAYKDLFAAAIG